MTIVKHVILPLLIELGIVSVGVSGFVSWNEYHNTFALSWAITMCIIVLPYTILLIMYCVWLTKGDSL